MSWTTFIKNLFGIETAEGETTNGTGKPAARYQNLSGADFKKQLKASDNPVLLDVRTAGEYQQGSLPKAKNIDYLSPTFAKKIQNLDKSATYFLYCRSGSRSAQACKLMQKQGFEVRNLSGGIGAY